MKLPFCLKNLLCLPVLLLLMNVAITQESCTDDIIMAVNGKWAKRTDANMNSYQSQANGRIDKMQQLLFAAYPNPKGAEAGWYRSMEGEGLRKDISVPFTLTAGVKTYYCNIHIHKLMLSGEGSAGIYIVANRLFWFAKKDEKFTIQNAPVYILTKKTTDINGFAAYEGNDNHHSNTGTTFSRTLLITRPGQSLFIPVTKKQYLQSFLKGRDSIYQMLLAQNNKMPVWSDAEEDAYKQKQIAIIEQNPFKAGIENNKKYFLKTYVTTRQKKENELNLTNQNHENDTRAAKEVLSTLSEEELAKPVYINSACNQTYFKEFANETNGGQMVQVNNAYFKTNLPKYVPQFLVIYWSWNTEKPSIDFANHIENNFNFSSLQQMLDK